jgi:asparagine synthase (glutamine-hydrolysing)
LLKEKHSYATGISYNVGMCGFFGVFTKKQSVLSDVKVFDLSKSICHRGPDGHSQIDNSYAKIVHHRLKITGGIENQQPIKFDNGDIFVFNGEIYNTKELTSRWSLRADPADDAQVFAEIWKRFGKKQIAEIDGVFAGAYISVRDKKLYLFRDRFGARPIFYRQSSLGVNFASEVHPLVDEAHSNSLNLEAIYDFIVVNMPLNSETHIDEVFEVPPATIISFELGANKIIKSDEKYWHYQWASDPGVEDEIAEHLREAVSSQIPTDVVYSSYLSGGIDSSLIAYYLSKHEPKLKTFTLSFDEGSDEFPEALETADFLGVDAHRVVFNDTYAKSNLNEVLTAVQAPRVGQSIVNYRVHEEASKHSKVVFSGAGADELFGGYPWRYPLIIKNGQVVPMNLSYEESLSWIQQKWSKLGDLNTLRKLFPAFNFIEILENRMTRLRTNLPVDLFDETDPWSPVKLAMRFDQQNFLPHLLTVDDALAMRFGLEARVPYLSNRVIDFASRVPFESLFSIDQRSNEILGKMPLRKLAQSIFGGRLSTAGKKGFSAPGSTWALPIGVNLLAKNESIWDFVDRSYFKEILEDKTDHNDRQISSTVWSIAALAHQFKHFEH